MGHVMHRGQQVRVGGSPSCNVPASPKWRRRQYRTWKHGPKFSAFGNGIATVEANLAAIQGHYGVNRTDAFKISLHLTARAIEQNTARPVITRTKGVKG